MITATNARNISRKHTIQECLEAIFCEVEAAASWSKATVDIHGRMSATLLSMLHELFSKPKMLRELMNFLEDGGYIAKAIAFNPADYPGRGLSPEECGYPGILQISWEE